MLGDLPVKINPHFGVRYADGRAEAVRLHFDEPPPSEELVLATLHLMARHMDAVLPHAEPVLVDVRRGEAHRRPPTPSPTRSNAGSPARPPPSAPSGPPPPNPTPNPGHRRAHAWQDRARSRM